MPGPTVVSYLDSLNGELDLEESVRRITPAYRVKGMFFSRIVDILGKDWEDIHTKLEQPPRSGRYLPFSDYPQSDYTRLSAFAAAKRFPNFSLREGMRRLAREDFLVFAGSTFGRVILAVARDVRSALLKAPLVYSKVAPGEWRIEASELDADTIRIEFHPHLGIWEYQVGQFEGVVHQFGGRPTITVEELADSSVRFDIRHR